MTVFSASHTHTSEECYQIGVFYRRDWGQLWQVQVSGFIERCGLGGGGGAGGVLDWRERPVEV